MEALSRLGQRITENIQEQTRDLTFAGSSRDLFESTDSSSDPRTTAAITAQLTSSHDREKIEGMKRLIALISKNRDVSTFFPVVVKNVSSPSLELRKLVYIYVLRYAEQEPDLALLSINSFQKDLNDPNPLIRSMAIRVLGGIRVPMIGSVVLMAIKKGVSDSNPYVRKAAALAIPKLYETDPTHHSSLLPLLTPLLSPQSGAIPLAPTLLAFSILAPYELSLLHPHYRHLCRTLPEADEWAQLALLDVLGRYARTFLRQPSAALGEEEDEDEEEEPDEDLVLLLQTSTACLFSSSPAVVLETIKLHHHLSPPPPNSPLPHLARPLLRLLASASSSDQLPEGVLLTVLKSCRVLVRERRDVFDDYDESDEGVAEGGVWRRFVVGVEDSRLVAVEKIGILGGLAKGDNVKDVLEEFVQYERSPDSVVSTTAIKALGESAGRLSEAREGVMKSLLKLLKSKRDTTITTTILTLKDLILSQNSASTSSSSTSSSALTARLASLLPSITSAPARACVIWLVGQFPGTENGGLMGAEVLRMGVKGFANESSQAKLALLTLSLKLLSLPPNPSFAQQLSLLASHLYTLARYDADYEVRDRARFCKGLVRGLLGENGSGEGVDGNGREEEDEEADQGGVVLRREQIAVVVGGDKTFSLAPPTKATKDGDEREDLSNIAGPSSQQFPHSSDDSPAFGTLSLLTHPPHFLPSYRPLPPWLQEGTDPSLRAEAALPPSRIQQQQQVSTSVNPNFGGSSSGGFGSEDLKRNAARAGGGGGMGVGMSGGGGGSGSGGASSNGKKKEVDLEKFYASSESEEAEDSSEEEDSDEPSESDDDQPGDVAIANPASLSASVSQPRQADGAGRPDPYVEDETPETSSEEEETSSEEEDSEEDGKGEKGELYSRFQ